MRPLVMLLLLLCVSVPTAAADYQSSPERQTAKEKKWGPWIGPYRAKIAGKLLEDFGEQYLYAPADAALPPPRPGEKRVVFLGDSITDRWNLARFFPGKPYVNRGIGGQVTPQMLVRFHADVVALHPVAVVILGGINDIAGVLQVETAKEIETNYRAMAELAEANRIAPIFTRLMPLNNYTANARDIFKDRDPATIAELNRWLTEFCAQRRYALIDYGPALRDARGMLKAVFTRDGLHPDDAGYAAMAPVAEKAIERVIGGIAANR